MKTSGKGNKKKIEKKIPKRITVDNELKELKEAYEKIEQLTTEQLSHYECLPLSSYTKKALKNSNFIKLTEVQKASIIPALQGRDIVAEAKTGSGKTLAFLVPLVERMFIDKIGPYDGPSAIIMTPTRELARQICLVLSKLAREHDFTILDIMGGKHKKMAQCEWERITNANVLVGTPGRMSQHQYENPHLQMAGVRMLVLDEADRLLETSFHNEVQAVLDSLPKGTQILLFSATQTKSVKQLIRLNIRSPKTVTIKNESETTTPEQLKEKFVKVELDRKFDYLYTFLMSHCKKKIIVFLSTQKQVRFFYELLRQLRVFFMVLQLRGNMKQDKRFEVYDQFARKQNGAVLLCTNIAERGLDFPRVDWVVQYDCPKDLNDYVHRVGRTARFECTGRAMLFLLPSELSLIDLLKQHKNIVIKETSFPESQIRCVREQVSCLLAAKQDLKEAGRLAVVGYLRDYALHTSGKGIMSSVFQPSSLPVVKYAKSMGLPDLPSLYPELYKLYNIDQSSSTSGSSKNIHLKKLMNNDDSHSDEDSGDELLVRKDQSQVKEDEDKESENDESPDFSPKLKKKQVTKVQQAKKLFKKGLKVHSKITFDEEGKAASREVGGVQVSVDDTVEQEGQLTGGLNLEEEKKRLKEMDKQDKETFRSRLKQERLKAKVKLKNALRKEVSSITDSDNDENVDTESERSDLTDSDDHSVDENECESVTEDKTNEEEDESGSDSENVTDEDDIHKNTVNNSETIKKTKKRFYVDDDDDNIYDVKRINIDSLESAALKLLE